MGKQFDMKQLSKDIAKEMNMVKRWIANRTARKMRNKLIQVYDTLITQFYSRPPELYVRHDVDKPYTEEGVNLYKALQSKGGEPPRTYELRTEYAPHSIDGGIMIDAEDMNDKNYGISKDIVLDYVINKGIRFPSGLPEMTFTASYTDSDCSASGTIVEVLESVRDQLADKYAKQAKEEAKKELKLKYIDIE